MDHNVIEWAPFRLRADRTEADLIAASDAFQEAFLREQPGFIRREIVRISQGMYADLVHWRSKMDADAVMQKAAESSVCNAYFAVMDIDSNDPSTGVAQYESVRVYR